MNVSTPQKTKQNEFKEPWLAITTEWHQDNGFCRATKEVNHPADADIVGSCDECGWGVSGKRNAERIVACVNALAGCPDPIKSMKAYKQVIGELEANGHDCDKYIEIDKMDRWCRMCEALSWMKDKS